MIHNDIRLFFLKKYVFKTVAVRLWKSESLVSIVQDDWKLRGWFARKRLINHDF